MIFITGCCCTTSQILMSVFFSSFFNSTKAESIGDTAAEVSFTQILHVSRSHENKGARLTSLHSVALTDAHSCPADAVL